MLIASGVTTFTGTVDLIAIPTALRARYLRSKCVSGLSLGAWTLPAGATVAALVGVRSVILFNLRPTYNHGMACCRM